MQTQDHLLLGKYLWRRFIRNGVPARRTAFLAGCTEPDRNPLTYLRGSMHHETFHGHHYGNACRHISRCLRGLQKKRHWTAWDYFVFGTVIHYVADAFTYPHNPFFPGNLTEHMNYERRLHRALLSAVASGFSPAFGPCAPHAVPFSAAQPYLNSTHENYSLQPAGMETDVRFIISTCSCLFRSAAAFLRLAPAQTAAEPEREVPYEGTYYNGLV